MLGATVFMVLAALAELAIPHYATKSIFAAGVAGATSEAFVGYLQILGGMVVAFGITAAIRGYFFSILNNRMTMRLRSQLFEALVRRETAFFDENEVGALTSRLQSDCQAITKCISTNLNIALRNSLQAIGGFIYLWILSKEMCMAALGVSAVLWIVTLIYGDFARRTQKVYSDVLAGGNQVAEESLSLARIVRTFNTESREQNRYVTWLQRLYSIGLRQAAGYSLFVLAGYGACYASKVVALVMGCSMVIKGALTAEQLTNFIFYIEFVIYASWNVCDEFTEFMEAVGASERVMNLLDSKPAPQLAAGKQVEDWSGTVELKDVVFRYPTRPSHTVLNGVSLELAPGKLVALVGLSGSGKSSVVSLLQRLYDPSGGAVLLDGVDLKEIDAGWYRTQIGVVSQEPRLFGDTIAANIAYGFDIDHASTSVSDNSSNNGSSSASHSGSSNGHISTLPSTSSPSDGQADVLAGGSGRAVTQAQIEDAARQANAHDFIMALPNGYQTMVTDKLLSGGQKQRIALARALIRNPKLLILDEATSALDAESEAQVQVALDKAMQDKGRTVVVIAHRLSTVRNADVIYVMDRGKVTEVGDHSELLGLKGIYWQLVVRQQYGIDPATAEAEIVASKAQDRLAPFPLHASTASLEEEITSVLINDGMTSSSNESSELHQHTSSVSTLRSLDCDITENSVAMTLDSIDAPPITGGSDNM